MNRDEYNKQMNARSRGRDYYNGFRTTKFSYAAVLAVPSDYDDEVEQMTQRVANGDTLRLEDVYA